MASEQEWILKRNCSITPRQMLRAYGALCGVSFAVACCFTWHGAWYVMCFALLEMTAVGAAFLVFGRHATDRERVALGEDCLLIEVIEAERARQFRLDPRWTRIESPAAYHRLIALLRNFGGVAAARF